ncbi:hypothetical protein D3C80_128090 [compost metagenome]
MNDEPVRGVQIGFDHDDLSDPSQASMKGADSVDDKDPVDEMEQGMDSLTRARLDAERDLSNQRAAEPSEASPSEGPGRPVNGFADLLASYLMSNKRVAPPSLDGASSAARAHYNALHAAETQRKLQKAHAELSAVSTELCGQLKSRNHYDRVMAEINGGGDAPYTMKLLQSEQDLDFNFKNQMEVLHKKVVRLNELKQDALYLVQNTEPTQMNKEALESLGETIASLKSKDIDDCPLLVKGKMESLKSNVDELMDSFKESFKEALTRFITLVMGGAKSASPRP